MLNKPMNLLKSKTALLLIALVLFSLGSVARAFAESAIQCHCFKNRSYYPADRFASDDYILATSFNSLLAKSFGIPKRQIVMIKMNEGVAQDDLLIGLKISKTTGMDIRKFFRLLKENNTWAKIISGLSQQEKIKNDPLLEALGSGMPVEEAGVRVADEIIGEFYRIKPEEINKLRLSGLNEKAINLVFILAHAGEQQPEVLVEQYGKQGKSWSEIAHNLGFEPAAAGKLIQVYPARKITE
ncbi:MAG: hypothetical protein ABFR35_04050 [Thermodesulfobacteriota bacterium]